MESKRETEKSREQGLTEAMELLEKRLPESPEDMREAVTALNQIAANYLEEYGEPETLSDTRREAIAENLFYIAKHWKRDGNRLMAEGLAVLAVRFI